MSTYHSSNHPIIATPPKKKLVTVSQILVKAHVKDEETCKTKQKVKEVDKILPSGKRLHNYGKSPFLMGKSTISMAMFNSFLCVYQAGYFNRETSLASLWDTSLEKTPVMS